MKNKRLILGMVLACPLAAVFMMATNGTPPRPRLPLTPIVSPTVIEWLLTPVMSSEQPNTAMPATAPLFATHAAIETQFAATVIALTPQDAKLR